MKLILLISIIFVAYVESAEVSCGLAFKKLANGCAHPTLSTKNSCCPAIRIFNENKCWCQPAGFSAARSLATNQYALSLRAEPCNIAKPLRPSFISRHSPPTLDTCPTNFASQTPEDISEGCANPEKLRKNRITSLNALDGLNLRSTDSNELSRFQSVVKKIFTSTAILSSVGLVDAKGITSITDFLLSRQMALGSDVAWVPENARLDTKNRFWRTEFVSYGLDYATSEGYISSKKIFAGFAKCSNKLKEVYVLEPGVVEAMTSQFYYPSNPKDAVSLYEVSPQEVCTKIENSCGSFSPYKSRKECIKTMNDLKAQSRVMCNHFDLEKTPIRALAGDTISCRYQYALAATSNPKRICQNIGPIGKGMCSETFCAKNQFEDPFSSSINPRYYESSTFSCNSISGECEELWPVE